MPNKSHCFNLSADPEVREWIQQFEEEFNEKFPNGNATSKRNYILKKFKDQQTQTRQNIESNSAAIKNLNQFILDAQNSQKRQGFKPDSYNQILRNHFLATGKHYIGAELNFENTTRSLVNQLQGDFDTNLINTFGKEFYDIVETKWNSEEGKILNDNIRREIARLNPKDNENIQATNDEKALKLAKIIDKHNRLGLEQMASFDIPFAKRILENNRKGYDGLQTHDKKKLRPTNDDNADFEAWRTFIQDKLIPSQNKIISNLEQGKLIFDKLVGDKISTRMYDLTKYVNDELDTSIDLKRGLYFKNIEASLEYDKKFGKEGGILIQTYSQLETFAKQINSKKEFGANPYAVLTRLQQIGNKENVKEKKRNFNSDVFTNYYDAIMGINDYTPGYKENLLTTINSNIRTFKNTTLYGTTSLTTNILDRNVAAMKRAQRNGGFDIIKELIKTPYTALEGIVSNINTIKNIFNSNTRRGLNITEYEQVRKMGVGVSAMVQETRKYYVDGNASKSIEWLSRKFNDWALLSHEQNLIDKKASAEIAWELARDLKYNWNDVNINRQTFLGKSGITEKEFNALKTVTPFKDNLTKEDLFYPAFVRNINYENIKPIISEKVSNIEKQKEIEIKALEEINKKENIKDYTIRQDNIVSKYNNELKNAYNIARIDLENKLRTSITVELAKIQSLSTLRNKINKDTGKRLGEIQRYFGQLKTAPSNYVTNILQSIVYDPNFKKLGKLGLLIASSASAILTAMVALWQLDTIIGKELSEINTNFLSRAILLSGVSTLYGEAANAIFGGLLGTSRNPEATMAINAINFASPILGNAVQLGGALKKGDTDRIIKTLQSNTPFQNHWLFRTVFFNLAFDSLSQALGGQGLDKRKRSISKQKNIIGNERDYLPPFNSFYNN